MKEVEPLFRCCECNRGILNRSVARCLYCGAALPPAARLTPEQVASREADLARLAARRSQVAAAQPEPASVSPLDVIDGVAAAADLMEVVGEGISAIGDLLS
ncbi:MAG: hypothetical protein K0R43_527 [Pseudoduganella sp.]|nr:hypothetical protein [Pseudoduganella sp.]